MGRRSLLLCAAFAVLAAACGGSSGPAHPTTCPPTGPSLHVEAHGFKFDTDCLAVHADEAITIVFDNEDPAPHNVDIRTSDGEELFKGDTFTGVKTVTYQVPAMEPGTYEFRCDVHPNTMQGTFIVR